MGLNSSDVKEIKRMSRHFHENAKNKVRTMERIHDPLPKKRNKYVDDDEVIDLNDSELWEEIYMESEDEFLKTLSKKKIRTDEFEEEYE
jgi:hypothetical protein